MEGLLPTFVSLIQIMSLPPFVSHERFHLIVNASEDTRLGERPKHPI
jgi:hypothetical protein